MRRAFAAVAGIAVSVVFGWLAVRGLNFHEVRSAIGDASLAWILAAVGVGVVGVAMRSERWRALFPRDSRPHAVPTFWASQVGLLANNVLPIRAVPNRWKTNSASRTISANPTMMDSGRCG